MSAILLLVLLIVAGVAGLRIGQKLGGKAWQIVCLVVAGVISVIGVAIAVALSSGIAIVVTTLTHVLISTVLIGMVF